MSQQNVLSSKQQQVLNDSFGLIEASQYHNDCCIWLPKLLDHEQCEKLLHQLTPLIHSPSLKVTASLLSKRFAFLATSSSLYAMTVYDAGLNMSAENCYLDYRYEQRLWRSKMPLNSLQVNYSKANTRVEWRDNVLSSLFANNLALLWQVLKEVTNIHPRILWENTAVRVYSLYEKKMNISCPIIRSRIADDYDYLLHKAPPELFGIDYNPLTRYNLPKISLVKSEKQIRFRKSCCFYYKATDPEEYCSNCPLLLATFKKRK